MNRIKNVSSTGEPNLVCLEVLDINNDSHYFNVRETDYIDYCQGKHIQDCFPYLSKEDREIMISGLTPEMWDSMFKDE
jgi:hypothetical protein